MMKRLYFLAIFIFVLSLITYEASNASEKDPAAPAFVKIYKEIFLPNCAEAGCHDGSFEPDFRTIQSSYNTLVLHPLIKNNRAGSFTYRVVPYDTAGSVLHERITNCCFVDENDRMPFYDKSGLTTAEIELISGWIMQGAPDIFGNIPKQQCTPPVITNLLLIGTDTSGKHIPIERKVVNNLGEQIAWRIDPSFTDLRLIINCKKEKWTCPADRLGTYRVSLYSDINYKKLIGSYNCSYYPEMNKIETVFPIKGLQPGRSIFVRLENTFMKDYAYPNTDLLEQVRYQWVFMMTKSKNP